MISMLYRPIKDMLTVLFTNAVTRTIVLYHLAVAMFALPWFFAVTNNLARFLLGWLILTCLYVTVVTLMAGYHVQRRHEQDLMLETIYRLENHTIDQ